MFTILVSPGCVAALTGPCRREDIRGLVRSCLRAEGLPVWENIEAELYQTREACLLIARPRGPKTAKKSPCGPRLDRGRKHPRPI